MFKNLRAEMARQDLIGKQIAAKTGISERAFSNRMRGRTEFLMDEIKDFLEKNKLPHIPFHGLRHTSATFLISRGMDIETVAGRLGHSTSATTQNVYSHFLESKDRQAADIMEDTFSKKKQEEKKKKVRKSKM
ncbi:MAG: hypothetical protein VR69_09940 [Peptococcaceae bacterium BRH_c4b]|nr:MAG: hypothetical protein VR69_09940 [Peptococcaceae bacterium BRH_c4b]